MQTKVLILGRERVGKTSFVSNLANKFRNDYIPTIGASVNKINDIIYWDISENFNTIDDTFYENSDYAIVMFDITFTPSFKGVRYYVDKVKRLSPSCKIILVGNKYDLVSHQTLRNETVKYYMDTEPSILEYITISCSKNTGIEQILYMISN